MTDLVSSRSTFIANITGRNALLLIGSSAFLLLCAASVIWASASYGDDSALWFIGFIVIALGAMSMAAAIFNALGFGAKDTDAFGLPTGSVRSLIAIAIMVLFIIFGLPFVRQHYGPRLLSANEIGAPLQVQCSALQHEIERYRQIGLVTTVSDADCRQPNSSSATVRLYGYTQKPDGITNQEGAKQILTTIITLLTTVVGFYFGSQSALSLVKMVAEKPQVSKNTPATGGGDDIPEGTGVDVDDDESSGKMSDGVDPAQTAE